MVPNLELQECNIVVLCHNEVDGRFIFVKASGLKPEVLLYTYRIIERSVLLCLVGLCDEIVFAVYVFFHFICYQFAQKSLWNS
jgi:hypothetical protein